VVLRSRWEGKVHKVSDGGLASAAVSISHGSLVVSVSVWTVEDIENLNVPSHRGTAKSSPWDLAYGFRHCILIRESRLPGVLVLSPIALIVPGRRGRMGWH
jgi:hypothetical protein